MLPPKKIKIPKKNVKNQNINIAPSTFLSSFFVKAKLWMKDEKRNIKKSKKNQQKQVIQVNYIIPGELGNPGERHITFRVYLP